MQSNYSHNINFYNSKRKGQNGYSSGNTCLSQNGNRIGDDQQGMDRANAIMAEGLDNLADLFELAEDDGIKTLCSSVRKPAGTIPQPGWVAPNPNPNNIVAPQVPRTGQVIPAICEQRLTTAAYGSHIYESIARPIDPASLNRARLREFKTHRTMVENHNDPKTLPEISKSYSIMKYLDQLPTYLSDVLGVSKVALSYVIRDTEAPPNPLPNLTASKPWSDGKGNLMEELVSFTPHTGPGFDADNAQLYSLLATHLGNTSAMASITQYQRRRNGREAYMDLVTHYMGSAKWEKTVESAEKLLATRILNRKNSRYPLRIHIARHREAYNDLMRALQQITYAPPNEASRVRYLLTSIQSSDPTICSGKTTIQADPVKKGDFEEAADFLLTICPAPKPQSQGNHRIAALKTNSKKGKIQTGPKTGVEVRFYRKDEWSKLSREEQREVRDIRQQELRDNKRKAEDNDKEGAPSKIAALEALIKEQSHQIASLKSCQESKPELPPKPKGNPLKPPTGFTQRE